MADKVKLYCAWFCPFAQRAWIALLHKGVDFEYVEQDPYDKTPEWLSVNPRGLVPAVIHEGKCIYESTVVLEYIDEAWKQGNRILPKDPYERALARIWSDHVTKKIVPPYYAHLMKKEEAARQESKDDFINNLRALTDAMKPEGPYFMGKEFGLVDIMVFPFVARIEVLKRLKHFELPSEPWCERLMTWFDTVSKMDCVKKTLPDIEKLTLKYVRYADDTAETEVATAIRKGKTLP